MRSEKRTDQESMSWSRWSSVLAPERASTKPRERGITMALDSGKPLAATEDWLRAVGNHIDHIKLGFGTSVLLREDILRTKIDCVRSHHVDIYPGGTLAEVALLQNAYPQYIRQVKDLGFSAVEISDGTIPMTAAVRSDAIKRALDAGLKVITEVGKKDPTVYIPVSAMCDQIAADLDCGADWVVIEARESGIGVGVFDEKGAMRTGMAEAILDVIKRREAKVIWEAPQRQQQAALIALCGTNVNLGNIQPDQVLGLEALRRGLRFETLRRFVEGQ